MSNTWISCNHVELTLGTRVPVDVLRAVTVTVDRGDYVAVVGPSGSGKSSLLHVLGCLRVPTRGSVTICGHTDPGTRLRTQLRRQRIGFVFQNYNLFGHLSAVENVAEGLAFDPIPYRTRLVRSRAMLDVVGLDHRASHRPGELSGGEQQRVAIARALVGQPDLLLADEPTGNLDSTSSASIMDTIGDAHTRGTTVVVVTHDLTVASRADRTIRIQDGRTVEGSG